MASEDDGFREIQLSGKQLVFLFMAATVVSVVIFLCGVLVGRGVRAERATLAQAQLQNESPVPDPAPPPQQATTVEADPRLAGPPPGVSEDPSSRSTDAAAPPAAEEPPVAVRRNEPAPEPKAAPPAPAPAAKAAPAAAAAKPADTRPDPKAAAPAAAPPAADAAAPRTGYAVQVAAMPGRSDADAMARRLSGKGYAAYVEQQKGNNLFRVRVGTFKTRREAQQVADRLKKEEKFKPWVTR